MTTGRRVERPELERTVTLVDAVVAISMTLLILPLVDVAPEVDRLDLATFWDQNKNKLTSFLVSFVVIYVFWRGHATLFRRLRESGQDEVRFLATINFGWLLMVAFLPFPTAVIGGRLTTITAPMYLISLLLLSACSLGLRMVVHRSIGLPLGPAWLTTGVIAVAAVVAFVQPSAGMYVLVALVVVRQFEGERPGRAGGRPGASDTS